MHPDRPGDEVSDVREPRFNTGVLAQQELPLSVQYEPIKHAIQSAGNRDEEGKEIKVSFRQLVSHFPSTTYGVFGLYRYPAKFIPQVVAYAIETYGRRGMTVIDPFAGSGTTGLVARMYGIHYELWDLNPLLDVIHNASILKPKPVDVSKLTDAIALSDRNWLPSWSRLNYWYPAEAIPFLARVWGAYHNLDEPYLRNLLVVPLLKVTKFFSFNDPQRQKLSRSPKSLQRVADLMRDNWQERFLRMIEEEITLVLQKLYEYSKLAGGAEEVNATVHSGVDSLQMAQETTSEFDLLITSPPYLQAQEYIRCSKLDLFWLGYSEEYIRQLAKREFPYCDVEPIEIQSKTYHDILETIEEEHLRRMFERYFYAVAGTLHHLAQRVRERMCLFVGPATVRGRSVPIDQIFAEHFTASGWKHEVTLVDTIAARVMFRSRVNPATGIEDRRMSTEHLVVLRRDS